VEAGKGVWAYFCSKTARKILISSQNAKFNFVGRLSVASPSQLDRQVARQYRHYLCRRLQRSTSE
jgi:hypothetical protein